MGNKITIDRRNFLKGATLVGGTALLAGVAGCTSPASGDAQATEAWMPTWDETTDVVVVGFGGAGAAASLAANVAGVRVIVLEKAPAAEGGSTGCASGSIHSAPKADPNDWKQKLNYGAYGTTDSDAISKMVDHAADMPDWFDSVGIPIDWAPMNKASNTEPAYSGGHISGYDGNEGRFLWQGTLKAADAHGIDYRVSCRVTQLIQNPVTKEILGVKASTPDGDKFIKAQKGVVLSCGGYGNNPLKQSQFNQPGVRMFPWGNIYNEGDGIDLAIGVGAALWHMHGLEWSAVGYRLASEKAGATVSSDATNGITPFQHVFVNKAGKRFMNEAKGMGHDIETKPVIDYSAANNEYKNLPFFMVFDQAMFDAGPLWIGSGRIGIVNTYAGVHKLIDWGADNTQALSNGWIFKGDTLEELASNIKGTTPAGVSVNGIDAAGLAKTVADFNTYAESGSDPEFGRSPDHMAPFGAPPYYAIEMCLSCINTQGGAQRNGDCQVIAPDGTPIPRLFSAGEFGSINGYVYVYGNIFEAYTSGRVAGNGAAALDNWDPNGD